MLHPSGLLGVNKLFAASFTKAKDMPLTIAVTLDLQDVAVAASLVIDSKTRAVQRILNLNLANSGFVPNPQELKEHLLDLGLACGILVAVVANAKAHMQHGHQLNSSEAAVADAENVLHRAHAYMAKAAMKGQPVVSLPLGPDGAWWSVTPEPLTGNWELIGLDSHVTMR